MSSTEEDPSSSLKSRLDRAERLLKEERRDREREEKKSLELLEEVKKRWESTERERLKHKDEELDRIKEELEQTTEVKRALKEKLKDCKEKLDEAITKYEQERKKNHHSRQVLSDGAENKPPQMESLSPMKPSVCKECEDYKSEMKLQKVEIRLAERKVRETEARIKLVREVMLKEEKEAREAAEAKLKEAEEAVKMAKVEAQKEIEKDLSELKDKLSDAQVKVDEGFSLKRRLHDAEAEATRAKNKLDEVISGELEELRKKENSHQMLKVTCLELQDQLAEYEQVSAKLETQLEEIKVKEDKSRRDKEKTIEEITLLKKEVHDLKSELALQSSRAKARGGEVETMEKDKRKAEEEWNTRLKRLNEINSEQAQAFSALKQEFEKISRQNETLEAELDSTSDTNLKLKEEVSAYHTQSSQLENANAKLHQVMEEMLTKIADKNEDIKERNTAIKEQKEQLEKSNAELERKKVQISQLKKLVDHLRSGKEDSHDFKKKPPLEWAMSYEEVHEHLEKERERNRNLIDELKQLKSRALSEVAAAPLEEATVRNLVKQKPVAETAHAIPHRFHKQTHLKAGQKCYVCQGSLPLMRAVNVCKFCHRHVHVDCEDGARADCGLSTDLALVLKSTNDNSEGVSHKGYLKIPEGSPETPGRTWKLVPVQIVKDKMVIDTGERNINLCPEKGFVFIQSTVAYSELLHTPAFDQPHVFKIGYSRGSKTRETHYFMAKTFQEKAVWIDALEKVTLTNENRQTTLHQDKLLGVEDHDVISLSPMKGGDRSSLVDFDVVATFPADNITIFCAVSFEDEEGHVLFGTSKGLFIGSACYSPAVQPVFAKDAGGPESVFQIGVLAECNDVLLVVGPERRLVVANTEDLLTTRTGAKHRFKHRNIEVVNCCHRFAARKFGPDSDKLNVDERRDDTFVCAVDDRRVSILARVNNTGEYQLRYGFSTDLPTTCLTFGVNSKTVLVATDKVYEIGLENFEVREFVDPSLAPSVFANNKLVDLFPLDGSKEYLICFQDYGFLVDENGHRSRGDIRWNGVAAQFMVSPGSGRTTSPSKRNSLQNPLTLWLARHNALEAVDIDVRAGSTALKLKCRNPQILSSSSCHPLASDVIFLEKRADTFVARILNRK